jgi:hypothetical protein
MTTFNGKHEDLEFICGSCGYGRENLIVDLDDISDANKLFNWLKQHSSKGGSYHNVPVETTNIKSVITKLTSALVHSDDDFVINLLRTSIQGLQKIQDKSGCTKDD